MHKNNATDRVYTYTIFVHNSILTIHLHKCIIIAVRTKQTLQVKADRQSTDYKNARQEKERIEAQSGRSYLKPLPT